MKMEEAIEVKNRNFLQKVWRGLTGLAFPEICICCGMPLQQSDYLCHYCSYDRFEDANPGGADSCAGVILPEAICVQDALWMYDKNDMLQQLIRELKYNGMGRLGVELGRLAGSRVAGARMRHHIAAGRGIVLLPVPLYPKKQRKRGYNQSERIARGVADVTGYTVAGEGDVSRIRNTRTQTGFSMARRMKNISGAFRLNRPDALSGNFVIIVDDVFTTGSTVFELARTIAPAEPAGIGIMTVAMA
jgi:ComF family protein